MKKKSLFMLLILASKLYGATAEGMVSTPEKTMEALGTKTSPPQDGSKIKSSTTLSSGFQLRFVDEPLTECPPLESLTFKTTATANLQMVIQKPKDWNKIQQRPAYVWIHGGAWIAGDAKGGIPQIRYFAHRGMVGISIDYRLIPKPGSSAFAQGPSLQDTVGDCRDAMRYLRKNASELGIHPNKIAVAGDSAGGHLVLALGALEDSSSEMLPYPNLLMACNPITDLDSKWGNYAQNPEMADRLSPIRHIRSEVRSPLLLLHGLSDHVVSPEQSKNFATEWLKKGYEAKVILYENALHAFACTNYSACDTEIIRAWQDMDQFMQSHGYLKGPADIVHNRYPAGPVKCQIPSELVFNGKQKQEMSLNSDVGGWLTQELEFKTSKTSGSLLRRNTMLGGELAFSHNKLGFRNRRFNVEFPPEAVKKDAWNTVRVTVSPEKITMTLNQKTLEVPNPAQISLSGNTITFGDRYEGELRNIQFSNLSQN